MKVTVVGSGYVGLVSGACLAEAGHEVICVDTDPAKVRAIEAGESPIHEKGLAAILKRHAGGALRATTDLAAAVTWASLTLIAVGTPSVHGRIDLRHIRHAAAGVGAALRNRTDYHAVVVKSTVVPGTTRQVVLPILEEHSGKTAGVDFGVGMNPEFLREGEAVGDFQNPDRIVLGGIDDRTLDRMAELYSPFAGADVLRTTPETAEMIKYAANGLLATLISYANEIGQVCAREGVDVREVMRGVHLDHRLNPILPEGRRANPGFLSYLEAGCGYGGSCFPKDVQALAAHGRAQGLPMRLLSAVHAINQHQPEVMLELLRKHHPDLLGLPVTVLGVAFKPGTDDIRESPSLPVIQKLLEAGARVTAHDPVAAAEAARQFGDRVTYAPTLAEAVQGASALLLMTRWDEYRSLPDLLRGRPDAPVVVDGRRLLDPASVPLYEGVGRGAPAPQPA
jgi:UDPglucose 6-dehydrogenase/GDP-mannose 6-dehydrogenase